MKTCKKLIIALKQRFYRQALPRKLEMDMVMLDRDEVEQFNRAGIDGGPAIMYDYIINTLLKIAPLQGEALDICCGSSQLLCKIAHAMPRMHFTGVDLSPRMLQFAGENKQRYGVSNVDFESGSMYELTAQFDRRFNLITWCDAMHHCDSEENVVHVLNQAGDLLLEGGCLLVFDFIRPKTGKLALAMTDLYARGSGDWLFQDNLDSYKAAFTFDETEDILRQTRLKNVRHIEPIIANAFQFILISPYHRRNVQQVCNLKHLWQKIDYGFMRFIFAGRI